MASQPARAVRNCADPFRSFWSAGFEGADHVNASGHPLDPTQATQHDRHAAADYARLLDFGVRTVRESVGWRLVEHDGRRDWHRVVDRARAARRTGMQVVWTLFHYGWPRGLDIFSAAFVDAFAAYCREAAQVLGEWSDAPAIYAPINEISFLTWAICETGLIHPFDGSLQARGPELKRQLVRAALAGCEAVWSVDGRARVLHADPLVHIVASQDRADLVEAARARRACQFDAWDMIAGRREPELGGSVRHLDLVGVNYYHDNQWEHDTGARLWWHLGDPRRTPFADLLAEAYARYGRPLMVSETSHVGEGRGAWIRDIAEDVRRARAAGVDVRSVCLYPALDRPDWENPARWHESGLWAVERAADGTLARRLNHAYAADFHVARHRVEGATAPCIPSEKEASMSPLVVFSHLRWDFVYQRPQHLMSRFAGDVPVLFVEEPVFDERPPFVERLTPMPGVTVLRPHTPVHAGGFHDDQLPAMRELVRDAVADAGFTDYLVWFYTPMALPLLQGLAPRAIVYDCMDELRAFRNAPRQLLQRESALLKVANVVFTGGPSLYAAKRDRHPAVHAFPSSVDVAHFAQGRDDTLAHPALASLPHPRLGFFGVIDERLDVELVARVAEARPDWQICLVGPVVKIDPASLPQQPNVHYLPQQPYAELPRFLAGWDVCLLPFARNESTQFISPTKTLEYMAARRPIVSTPIADVVSLYGEGVGIAATWEEFVAACERALDESDAARDARIAVQDRLTAGTSWDATAQAMRALMEHALADGLNASARAMLDIGAESRARGGVARKHAPCVVLGAGPTGLSAAHHLGADSLLLERNPTVGGWCRSVQDKGFTFDCAGHIMFSNDPWVLDLYRKLLGDNVHWQNREAWIHSHGVDTRYPFQGSLHGLPPQVLKECLVGAIEARFGPLKGTAASAPASAGPAPVPVCAESSAATPFAPVNASGVAGVSVAAASSLSGATVLQAPLTPRLKPATPCDPKDPVDCCGDGVAELPARRTADGAPAAANAGAPPRNFEEFIHRVWGAGVAKHFAIPYNRKLWTVPLSEMETSWLGGRVPLPDLEEMIEGALSPTPKPMGPNARFGYPLVGGFQAMMNGFLPLLEGDLECDAEVLAVSPSTRTVMLADGRSCTYDVLISTLPLPQLVRALGEEAPPEIRHAARALKHVSVRCVNIGVGRANLTDKHWIYYPEDTVFHRLFLQGNASPYCNPPDGFGITCEISYSPTKPLPVEGDALVRRCIEDCVKVGMIREDDPILTTSQVDMPYAYVIYDHTRAQNVQRIRSWLEAHRILLAGRYSEWEYYNSDHAFLAGRKAAAAARSMLGTNAAQARSA